MGREKRVVLPSLQRLLIDVGENIHLARLRRRLSSSMVAERAGISRNTLRYIERGDPNVGFGVYASVLHCLGLERDLLQIAKDDEFGRKLQDAQLPTKARAPKIKKTHD